MKSSRILYVDDDDDIREIATMALGLDPEFQVRSCDSGAAAIEVAGAWQPELVLLDVMMPGMDGPTTFAKLLSAQSTADIPVVFITAKTQQDEVDRFIALGARGVIAKPFDPMNLAHVARSFLEGTAAAVPS